MNNVSEMYCEHCKKDVGVEIMEVLSSEITSHTESEEHVEMYICEKCHSMLEEVRIMDEKIFEE